MSLWPMITAAAFATIVGLLSIFRQERGESKRLTHQEFIEWVEYHRHEDLKNLILNNAALSAEIDTLLQADHAIMIEKLNHIESILLSLLSKMDEFKGIASAVDSDALLSDQAVSILRQFVKSGENYFVFMSWQGEKFSIQLGRGSQFEITEPRFIEDDLNQLAGLGLLNEDFGSGESRIFKITRNAAHLIEAMDKH